MENWTTFLLVNVVLVIVLGVITNLVTPSIKSWYDKSVFSSKKKRIASLIQDYKVIKESKENTNKFIAVLMDKILMIILGISFTAYTIGAFVVPNLFGTHQLSYGEAMFFRMIFVIYLVWIFYTVFSTRTLIDNISDFDTYREQTIVKIKKLGGNPADLDK